MKKITSIQEMREEILYQRDQGYSLGFVPTMGALHQGHLSLLERSVAENDISICSIFVNPIQFNNKNDLEKYPRTFEDDCRQLENADCDIVFAPSVNEMYPEETKASFDFGKLERLMEGEHRPGHFNGVAIVVDKLFEICMPHKAYFGEKDFQQLMIIRELVKIKQLNVEVVGCPIIREADGLAMSSRNIRLNQHERTIAPVIYNTLEWMKSEARMISVPDMLEQAKARFSNYTELKLEYVQLVDENTLFSVNNWSEVEDIRAFVALFLGDVRLIDNMKIT